MNTKLNSFLLAGDTFMPEIHFRQSGLTYWACVPFIKKRTNKKIKKQEIRDIFIKTH